MVYTQYQGVVKRNLNKVMAVGAILALVTTMALSSITSAATSTVVVTGDTAAGNNQPGWLFNRDTSTDTPFEFNSDEASVGVGSLHVQPIGANASDKFVGELFYLGEIADVTSVSYDFKTNNASDADQFYLNLYVNDGSDPTEFYDCRYNVVPTTTSPDPVTGFTTVTYDLSDPATSVTQRVTSSIVPCPASPAGLPAGAVLRAVQLNVGDTSASDTGLEGYLDNVVISAAGDSTVYDFEPALTPATKDECKKNGWQTFNTPVFKNQGDCVSFVNHL